MAALLFLLFCSRGRLMKLLGMQETAGRDKDNGMAPAVLGREQPFPRITLAILGWAFVVAVALTVIFVLFPVNAPRVIGAGGIALLALAGINLFGSFVLTLLPLRNRLPALWPIALLVTALFSSCNDNHAVRQAAPETDALPDRRSLREALEDWRNGQGAGARDRLPLIVVATEGGGIRAAYWTAAVLEELDATLPEAFRRRLFALSGVSGGSLGAAGYLAASFFGPPRCLDQGPPCEGKVTATAVLGQDFLAAPVAGLLFQDLMQRFWFRPVPAFDRSRGLELAWQQAFSLWPGQPMAQTLPRLYAAHPDLPLLLLNTTVVESGKRAVLSNLTTEAFTDVVDLMRPGSSALGQPLAGLVHDSARFPVISPAGTIEADGKPAHRVVDGGYFDNSGTITALEMIRALVKDEPRLRPILLILRNDSRAPPICSEGISVPARCNPRPRPPVLGPAPPLAFLHETLSPILGLYNARAAHARLAAMAAAREVESELGGSVFEFALQESRKGERAHAPLGWTLSNAALKSIRQQAAERVRERLPALLVALESAPAGAPR